jgi:hypothetical protein
LLVIAGLLAVWTTLVAGGYRFVLAREWHGEAVCSEADPRGPTTVDARRKNAWSSADSRVLAWLR